MPYNYLTPSRSGKSIGERRRDPLSQLHSEINQLFDDVFFRGGYMPAESGSSRSMISPDIDVSEDDSQICVTMELPGVTEDDIDVQLNDDILTIRGEKKSEETRGGGEQNFHIVERSYGAFQRSLRLPYLADPGKVEAQFQNGVLRVVLPKADQEQRSRRIPVRGKGSEQTESVDVQSGTQPSQSGEQQQEASGTQYRETQEGSDESVGAFGRPGEGPEPTPRGAHG